MTEPVERPEREKISKATAYYQARPMLGEYCADCAKFIPGDTEQTMGRCVNVAGPIAPRGWCQFFKAEKKKEEDDE